MFLVPDAVVKLTAGKVRKVHMLSGHRHWDFYLVSSLTDIAHVHNIFCVAAVPVKSYCYSCLYTLYDHFSWASELHSLHFFLKTREFFLEMNLEPERRTDDTRFIPSSYVEIDRMDH